MSFNEYETTNIPDHKLLKDIRQFSVDKSPYRYPMVMDYCSGNDKTMENLMTVELEKKKNENMR